MQCMFSHQTSDKHAAPQVPSMDTFRHFLPHRTFRGLVSSSLLRLARRSLSPADSSPLLALFLNPDVSETILEAVLADPSGRRTLSRLACVSKELKEPALALLWRELDSFVPLLLLFPPRLLKRDVDQIGLVRAPKPKDWTRILVYGKFVRGMSFDEFRFGRRAPIFPTIQANWPTSYILPHLTSLVWTCATTEGLAGCSHFLGPELQSMTLDDGGVHSGEISDYLVTMAAHKCLSSIKIRCHESPLGLRDVSSRIVTWERFSLHSFGPLSEDLLEWLSSLPRLHRLKLDVPHISRRQILEDNYAPIARRSFESQFRPGPTYIHLFRGKFTQLSSLRLNDDSLSISAFLGFATSPLCQLTLIISDERLSHDDWRRMCAIICRQFADTLQILRVSGGPSNSRVVRNESSRKLPLTYLAAFPHLRCLDIDFSRWSLVFNDDDILNLSTSCLTLEELQLHPVVRFPQVDQTPCRFYWSYAQRDSPTRLVTCTPMPWRG
ncbi:hypothetical protein BKA93DRAFT_454041 [Sparassis latifolia]